MDLAEDINTNGGEHIISKRESDKSFDEAKVADFTISPEERNEDQPKIRLKSAIDIRSLMSNEGIVLDPEIDDALDSEHDPNNPANREYFVNAAKDENIERLLAGMEGEKDVDGSKSDPEGDDGASEFEIKAKKMVNVSDDGGVKKKILRSGLECAGSVPDRATITVHYSLYLEGQDEPYDSSVLRGKCERYILDDGHLLPGLEIAIKSMKKHEQSEFLISPIYAFGEYGCPPRVPPSSEIRANIELLDFVQEGEAEALLNIPPAERGRTYTFSDVLKITSREHAEGNDYVKNAEYKLAIRRYVNACKLLEEVGLKNEQEQEAQKRLLKKLWLNRSYCYLKINHPKQACVVLQQAIEEFPKEAKALYRMGKAKKMLANYEESRRYFLKALSIRPDDEDIGRELAMIDRYLKLEQDNERALCRKMFDNQVNPRGQDKSVHLLGNKPVPSVSGTEVQIDDEDYEEMVDQLKGFKMSNQSEMHLPSGFRKDDIRVAKTVADSIGGLEVVEFRATGGGSQKRWKIIKVQ